MSSSTQSLKIKHHHKWPIIVDKYDVMRSCWEIFGWQTTQQPHLFPQYFDFLVSALRDKILSESVGICLLCYSSEQMWLWMWLCWVNNIGGWSSMRAHFFAISFSKQQWGEVLWGKTPFIWWLFLKWPQFFVDIMNMPRSKKKMPWGCDLDLKGVIDNC